MLVPAALPGVAKKGHGDDRDSGGSVGLSKRQRFPGSRVDAYRMR